MAWRHPTRASTTPRVVRPWRFRDAASVDLSRHLRADQQRQHCLVLPEEWYVEATFVCTRCTQRFAFTPEEQRHWYEELGFWIDSVPRQCAPCRQRARRTHAITQQLAILCRSKPAAAAHGAEILPLIRELIALEAPVGVRFRQRLFAAINATGPDDGRELKAALGLLPDRDPSAQR